MAGRRGATPALLAGACWLGLEGQRAQAQAVDALRRPPSRPCFPPTPCALGQVEAWGLGFFRKTVW